MVDVFVQDLNGAGQLFTGVDCTVMRECTKCKVLLPLQPKFFYRDKYNAFGYKTQCKKCSAKTKKELRTITGIDNTLTLAQQVSLKIPHRNLTSWFDAIDSTHPNLFVDFKHFLTLLNGNCEFCDSYTTCFILEDSTAHATCETCRKSVHACGSIAGYIDHCKQVVWQNVLAQ